MEQAPADGGAQSLAWRDDGAPSAARRLPGGGIKLKYLSQSKTRPPTFYLSCSRPEALPDAYRRYIVNGLREDFGLAGVPIRLMVRAEKNPYEGRRRKS